MYTVDGRGETSINSELASGAPSAPVNVEFRIEVSGIDSISYIHIGSDDFDNASFTWYPLTPTGTANEYSGTFSIQPGASVSYKYTSQITT